ncbi:MAG: MFS transporter [Candidatus Bathyarchaeota archaeon]|nr:MFS transporter [Candidatus Bathyarchaeota archaeon]
MRFILPFEVLNIDLKLIFTSNFIGAFGDGLFSYLLPYYITEYLGASASEMGMLYTVTFLVSAITLLTAGIIADKYDRKKVMIAGWLAWIPAPLLFSIAKNWVQMLPGMILWGFWLSGPTSTAYVVSTADKNKLTLTFTVLSASWSIGYIFSPAVGGYLANIIGMQKVFYVSFIFYTAACLILTLIRSQRPQLHPQRKNDASGDSIRMKKLVFLSAFFALVTFVTMMFRQLIPKFLWDAYGYGDFKIGLLGSVSFFGSAVLGLLLGRLGDRWRKSYAIAASMIICSSSLILLLCSGNIYVLSVAFFLLGASYITWSLMSAVVGPLAPEHMRARWISIPQMVSMFSSFLAPYVGGRLYEISPHYLFTASIIASFLIAMLSFLKIFE